MKKEKNEDLKKHEKLFSSLLKKYEKKISQNSLFFSHSDEETYHALSYLAISLDEYKAVKQFLTMIDFGKNVEYTPNPSAIEMDKLVSFYKNHSDYIINHSRHFCPESHEQSSFWEKCSSIFTEMQQLETIDESNSKKRRKKNEREEFLTKEQKVQLNQSFIRKISIKEQIQIILDQDFETFQLFCLSKDSSSFPGLKNISDSLYFFLNRALDKIRNHYDSTAPQGSIFEWIQATFSKIQNLQQEKQALANTLKFMQQSQRNPSENKASINEQYKKNNEVWAKLNEKKENQLFYEEEEKLRNKISQLNEQNKTIFISYEKEVKQKEKLKEKIEKMGIEALRLRIQDSSRCLSESEQHFYTIKKIQQILSQKIDSFTLAYRKGQFDKKLRKDLLSKSPNLLFLIKTKMHKIVGGLTSKSLCGKYFSRKNSKVIIFCVENKSFNCLNGSNLIQQESDEIIIGNSKIQMKIDKDENEVRICCGDQMGREGQIMEEFWGSEASSSEIEEMQVFRVHFEDEVMAPSEKSPSQSKQSTKQNIQPDCENYHQITGEELNQIKNENILLKKEQLMLKKSLDQSLEKIILLQKQLTESKQKMRQFTQQQLRKDQKYSGIQNKKLKEQMHFNQISTVEKDQNWENLELQNQRNKLMAEVKQLEKDLMANNEYYDEKQRLFQNQEQRMRRIKQEITQCGTIQQQYNKIVSNIRNEQKKLKQLHQNCEVLKLEINKIQKCKEQTLKQIEQKQKTLIEMKMNIEIQKEKYQTVMSKKQTMIREIVKEQPLFIGEVLKATEERQYLLTQLRKMLPQHRKIVHTKLLYAYPLMMTVNFHACVDNIPFFVVLFRLENDHTIAFYSQIQYSDSVNAIDGPGFLSSLTNETTYFLKSENSLKVAVVLFKYDNYYLEIGNSDLRLELHKKNSEVISDLGKRFSFFNSREDKTEKLFGKAERSMPVKSYQVFQIVFD